MNQHSMKTLSAPLILVSATLVLVASLAFAAQAQYTMVVEGTGDSQEMLRAVASKFMVANSGIKVEIPDSIGSGGGIKALLDNRVKLVRTARPLTDKEISAGLREMVFALSPIVFVMHPSISGVRSISPARVVEIYSGKTQYWKDLGATGGKIYPVGREPGDSSRTVLEKKIPGFREIEKPRAKECFNTPEAVETIAANPGTIGYLPLSMAVTHKLAYLSFEEIEPTAENVLSGKYPIVVKLAIVTKENPTGAEKKFMDFLRSNEAHKVIRQFGCIPVLK